MRLVIAAILGCMVGGTVGAGAIALIVAGSDGRWRR